jgi:hypothetical protein
MFKNRKNLTLTLVGVGVLLLAITYFFVVPLIQSNAYRDAVSAKQPEVQTQFEKFEALLDRDVFTKSEVELSTVRADIKASEDVTADTKEALSRYNDHVNNFTELPLLDWNSTYKNTRDLNSAEIAYVSEGNEAVKEMEAVLVYLNSSADLATELKTVENDFGSMENIESLEEFQRTLDKAVATLDKVVPKLEQLNAPESLSEQHELESKMGKEFLSNLKQYSQAIKNLDLAKLESAGKNIETLSAQYDKDIERVNKAFINESKLRKHIDAAGEADTSAKRLLEA